jgi:hypothetical protein
VRATYDDPALAGVEKRDLIVPPTAPPAIGVRYPHVPAGDATRSSAIHTTTGS